MHLEPTGASDGELLVELHEDPGIARWFGGCWTQDQAQHFATDRAQRWHRDGVGKWLAHRRADGVLVGRGGLFYVQLLDETRLEVGWSLRQHFWGNGYATEIGRAALDLAFRELATQEVIAFTKVHNAGSNSVMERLGMPLRQVIYRLGLVAGSARDQDLAPFALYRTPHPPQRQGETPGVP